MSELDNPTHEIHFIYIPHNSVTNINLQLKSWIPTPVKKFIEVRVKKSIS